MVPFGIFRMRHQSFVALCVLCVCASLWLGVPWLAFGFSTLLCVWLQPWLFLRTWFRASVHRRLSVCVDLPHRFQAYDATSALGALGMVLDLWHMRGVLPCVRPEGSADPHFCCYDTSCPGMDEDALLAQARALAISHTGALCDTRHMAMLAAQMGCVADIAQMQGVDTVAQRLLKGVPLVVPYASDKHAGWLLWGRKRTQWCVCVGVGRMWGVQWVATVSSMHKDGHLVYVPWCVFKHCCVRAGVTGRGVLCVKPLKEC
jgi:hypothetical protein